MVLIFDFNICAIIGCQAHTIAIPDIQKPVPIFR